MSMRGRRLFDNYVTNYLNQPQLVSLSIQSHAFTLTGQARAQLVPMHEITEEVGPLVAALTGAVTRKN